MRKTPERVTARVVCSPRVAQLGSTIRGAARRSHVDAALGGQQELRKLHFKFGNYKLRYAWVSQRGYYPEDLDKRNQDAHISAEAFGESKGIRDCALFGVFDGHGKLGDHCAIFTRDHMPNMLLKELAKGPPEKLSVEESYTNTFLEVNNALHERVDIDDSLSGTTAITVLKGHDLRRQRRRLARDHRRGATAARRLPALFRPDALP